MLAVVILAAGQGTRMKSPLPKVLHEVAGRPLLEHVLLAVAPLKADRTIVVVGHKADEVRARFANVPAAEGVTWALQGEQLGTGHALLQTQPLLGDALGEDGAILVLNGDGPLLRPETLRALIAKQVELREGMTLLTCRVADPSGLGRVIRLEDGSVARVTEEKDATPTEKAVREINTGIYIFDRNVFRVAAQLENANASSEYYITDLVGLYLSAGYRVQAVESSDEVEVMGVNDREQLGRAERLLRGRVQS